MVGKELVCSLLALLCHSLNPLFCERAKLRVRLEPFVGKFSFLQLRLDMYSVGLFVCLFFLLVMLPSGEGNGTPLQCSCLENPMDGGAW